jgi:hypothetical protein
MPKAPIVFDKFQVMKHDNAAVDETRRAEFFRQRGPLQAILCGKRRLLLTKRHLDGIRAYRNRKVPFGVVEAIHGNIRAMMRRRRGYWDDEYLILKVQKATDQARLAGAVSIASALHILPKTAKNEGRRNTRRPSENSCRGGCRSSTFLIAPPALQRPRHEPRREPPERSAGALGRGGRPASGLTLGLPPF